MGIFSQQDVAQSHIANVTLDILHDTSCSHPVHLVCGVLYVQVILATIFTGHESPGYLLWG